MTEDHEIHWEWVKSCSEGVAGQAGSGDWPAVMAAITAISGYQFTVHKSGHWLRGFCEGLMIQAGRA